MTDTDEMTTLRTALRRLQRAHARWQRSTERYERECDEALAGLSPEAEAIARRMAGLAPRREVQS